MTITLDEISKKYNKEYIFKNLEYTFETGKSYAITGANGSGKSTLLQVVAGYMLPSKGQIIVNDGDPIDNEELYQYISMATPYLELVEEFTLNEHIDFHFKFKKPILSKNEFIATLYLKGAEDKLIKNFSSGMKQRLKLGLALFSDVPVVCLDEPTTNLDTQGSNWYKEHVTELKDRDKLIVIASNQPEEYDFCDAIINIENHK